MPDPDCLPCHHWTPATAPADTAEGLLRELAEKENSIVLIHKHDKLKGNQELWDWIHDMQTRARRLLEGK